MSGARPFRDVKLQWLQQLSCDKDLSDSARSVALYIITTHLNGHTEKAWPSYQTIADATGKSVKTIQRAIRELETSGWFGIRRGNGIGHNTEYRPSAATILRASHAREKTDKIVTLYPDKGGQNRPERRSDLSGEGGQICPPNPEKEKIYKPNPREHAPPRVETRRAVPLVFVAETKADQLEQWRIWLRHHGRLSIEALGLRTVKAGKLGYALPGYWPPDEASPIALDCIAFFCHRRDHIAEKAVRQTDLRRAS
ncbi:helix-turn-helix domain-containing protein [Rhizobium halophytocola]|uniref:DNA-binding transcriptional regulator YhcF (GntR family) n=1 Tax=Rhizobium halophytocola TaxID=735519 RepID=A0ABS4E3K0_9HYPH|nr:helix-turn-helix domain-containing protein [Rhizobium halophytocola]MBP1852503.1 DNA-binding transcriptional regulator YhcF (GntR family) [Rhizobium halophytocola]